MDLCAHLRLPCLLFLLIPILLTAHEPASNPSFIHSEESAYSYVFESSNLLKLKSYIDNRSIFIFDIDNTAIRPKTMYGSAQWFYYLVTQQLKKGLAYSDAITLLYPKWIEAQEAVQVEPVDLRFPQLIKDLQAQGIPVLALSARRASVATKTLEQLNSVDIDLSNNPFSHMDISFDMPHPAYFAEGVIFADDLNDKGEVLKHFFKQICAQDPSFLQKYRRLVFVDDHKNNPGRVQRAAMKYQMEYVGMRYAAEDFRVAQFDPKIAEKQCEFLRGILPDPVAQHLLKNPESLECVKHAQNPLDFSSRFDYSLQQMKLNSPPEAVRAPTEQVRIFETTHITDVLQETSPKTLVVFNLNDTLMFPEQALGSDQWASQVIQDRVNQGTAREEVIDRLVPLWHSILLQTKVRPVEALSATTIRSLQRSGCPVIGLTARYIEMAYPTIEQLKSLAIDFSRGWASQNDFTVQVAYPAKFLQGILFAGLQNTLSSSLTQFLLQSPFEFDRILVVDSSLERLEELASLSTTFNKPFVGVWYRAVEKNEKPIDPNIAKLQLALFGKVLPDRLAAQLIK